MRTSIESSVLNLFGVILPPLLIFVKISAGQDFSGCIDGYYLYNGTCEHCPDSCKTCISDISCTTCERNYYGQTCQLTCDDKCEGVCHKTHGHCTFGCRDGHYPVPGTLRCLSCASDCQVCSSYDDCLLYKDVDSVTTSYHANTHQEVSKTITITAIIIASILVINICGAAFIIYRRVKPKTFNANEERDEGTNSHPLPEAATHESGMTDESSLSLLQKPTSSRASNTESTGV